MGAIKIIAWIRLYGIPELLIFYTSYKAFVDIEFIDMRLDNLMRVLTLIVVCTYTYFKIDGIIIDNRNKSIELRIREAELRSIELDNQLKEKELKK